MAGEIERLAHDALCLNAVFRAYAGVVEEAFPLAGRFFVILVGESYLGQVIWGGIAGGGAYSGHFAEEPCGLLAVTFGIGNVSLVESRGGAIFFS